MARRKRKVKTLSTICEVDDERWTTIQDILDELDPAAETGRLRTNPRQALNGIIYQMRGGLQWNQLPTQVGDDSSVHRTLQRWVGKRTPGWLSRVLTDIHTSPAINWADRA